MSQSLFKVIEVSRSDVYSSQIEGDTINKYFRIVLAEDALGSSAAYPIVLPENADTLKAIAELLTYEGDTKLCVFPIRNYNRARSQIFLGGDKNYSLQVEALFIINQLVYKEPFNYSSYPILVDKKTNKIDCINGKVIYKAYEAYRNWYKELMRKGIGYIRNESIMPLDGSGVKWY